MWCIFAIPSRYGSFWQGGGGLDPLPASPGPPPPLPSAQATPWGGGGDLVGQKPPLCVSFRMDPLTNGGGLGCYLRSSKISPPIGPHWWDRFEVDMGWLKITILG